MEFKDFLGHDIKIGDTIAYLTGGFNERSSFKKAVIIDLVEKRTNTDVVSRSLRLRAEGSDRLIAFYTFDRCIVAAK